MSDPAAQVSLIDRFLVGRVRRGSASAFRRLHARHTPRLRRVLAAALDGDDALVDDALQETWLAAVRGLAGFRGAAAFGTWLHTIAVRTARHLRRREGAPYEPVDMVASPHPLAERIPLRVDLQRSLATLTERDRTVLLLHDVAGYGHAEIARSLGVPVGTSKSTLHRARGRMRAALGDGTEEES